jgi:hypothetical protein
MTVTLGGVCMKRFEITTRVAGPGRRLADQHLIEYAGE